MATPTIHSERATMTLPSRSAGSSGRGLLAAIFAATGFAALALQVVWQRLISLHSGVDLSSTTTVVAAFLGGLGLGSLAAGPLADRWGPRRSLAAFAAANVAIAAIAAVSTWLFYDLYERVAPDLASTAATFGFNAAVVLVPTALMGLSLPLLARGVVDRLTDAGTVVGRLYALNTVGAALGAAATGWFLLGTLDFLNVTRLAALIYLAAGLAAALIARSTPKPATRNPLTPAAPSPAATSTVASSAGTTASTRSGSDPASLGGIDALSGIDAATATATATDTGTGRVSRPVRAGRRGARMWPWMVAYGGTGAVALGLEQVFFRLVDTVMRSNSYSFAHVLSLYLVLFGIGAALGARLLARGADPRRTFLALQAGVAAGAVGGLVMLTRVLPAIGLREPLQEYFGTNGFNVGFGQATSLRGAAALVFAYLGAPLLLMGVPVLCAGAAYPAIQATVTDRFEHLGRRTGTLLFANVVGNVAGTLLTGFVLIDRLGTAGTLQLLAGLLGLGVTVAALARRPGGLRAPRNARHARQPTARPGSGRAQLKIVAVAACGVVLVAAVPSNQRLWAQLHGVETDQIQLEEQRSCAVALKQDEQGQPMLYINGSSQNGYPFDDFHVVIGLLPSLVHPNPQLSLAIGMGIGATAYGMVAETRLDRIETVELCGGQYPLLRQLGAERADELARLFADPRVGTSVGDGRKFLLTQPTRYDVVTVDTLRPQSGYSGSLYSVEFYELVAKRLAPGGILAQWTPTARTLNSATMVFPYVVTIPVASYGGSRFMLASHEPIDINPERLAQRFSDIPMGTFSATQQASLEAFMSGLSITCEANGTGTPATPEDLLNRDLAPRDEYFLNNNLAVPTTSRCGS
ncbi:MAG: fused MFS/spermidine synthase [Acidimicrobiales bacterium]